jgi:hypothetical protein
MSPLHKNDTTLLCWQIQHTKGLLSDKHSCFVLGRSIVRILMRRQLYSLRLAVIFFNFSKKFTVGSLRGIFAAYCISLPVLHSVIFLSFLIRYFKTSVSESTIINKKVFKRDLTGITHYKFPKFFYLKFKHFIGPNCSIILPENNTFFMR